MNEPKQYWIKEEDLGRISGHVYVWNICPQPTRMTKVIVKSAYDEMLKVLLDLANSDPFEWDEEDRKNYEFYAALKADIKEEIDEYTPTCNSCGEKDPTTCNRIDPYAYEIHDEEIEVFWCDECTQRQREDI